MEYYQKRMESVYGIVIPDTEKENLAQLLAKRYMLQRKSYEVVLNNTSSDVVANMSDLSILSMLVEIHATQVDEYMQITGKVREMLFSR